MTRWTRLLILLSLVALAGCTTGGSDGPTATLVFEEDSGGTQTATPDSPNQTLVPTATPPGSTARSATSTPTVRPTPTPTPSPGFAFDPAGSLNATVTDVVDGDTIDVRLENGSEETIRFVGVDTPEVYVENDPAEFEGVPDTDAGATCLREAGYNASDYLRAQIGDADVRLLFDENTDRRGYYGRLLAYIVHDGQNINYALVDSGHARVYDNDFTLRDEFDAAELDARDAQRELWRCQNAG